MRRKTKLNFIWAIILISITSNISLITFINKALIENLEIKNSIDVPSSSNINSENVIIFFNLSTYNPLVKERFEYYGGKVKEGEDWNAMFTQFSGFAGKIPLENFSNFRGEFPDINIENDEIIITQMNYISVQTQAANKTWVDNGLKGETGASIAVLDTGINPAHDYIQNNIIGWENFVNSDPISDDNGHGTLISSFLNYPTK